MQGIAMLVRFTTLCVAEDQLAERQLTDVTEEECDSERNQTHPHDTTDRLRHVGSDDTHEALGCQEFMPFPNRSAGDEFPAEWRRIS